MAGDDLARVFFNIYLFFSILFASTCTVLLNICYILKAFNVQLKWHSIKLVLLDERHFFSTERVANRATTQRKTFI